LAQRFLSPFTLVVAQSEADAGRLAAIGATVAPFTANLKLALPVESADEGTLNQWQSAVGDRPWWLAASVHPQEIDAIIRAHLLAAAQLPGLLTVIVPRHPDKAPMIEAMVSGQGLTVACRSSGEAPDRHVYLADTFGELPLFYCAAPLGLIGGTLFEHGGQNPVEAVRQGCVVVHGPSVFNFSEIFEQLERADATYPIDGGDALAAVLKEVLSDPECLVPRAHRAHASLDGHDAIMARLWPALSPLFQAAGLTALASET
jgi:3-deoxy-D-manno-octulosonic-acid transferase